MTPAAPILPAQKGRRRISALVARCSRSLRRLYRGDNHAPIILPDHARAGCMRADLGEGRAVVRVLGRYKMFVDTLGEARCARLQLAGYWNMPATQSLADLIVPGATCVDIGAGAGYFTLLMADIVGPAGMVYACEPDARLRRMLEDSARINGFSARIRSRAELDAPLPPAAFVRADAELLHSLWPCLRDRPAPVTLMIEPAPRETAALLSEAEHAGFVPHWIDPAGVDRALVLVR